MRFLLSFSNKHIKRFHLAILALSGIFLIFTGLVGLATPAKALVISPPRIELSGDPGTTINGEFKAYTDSPAPQTYYTQVENFEAKDETGSPQLIQTVDGLASWVQVLPSVTAAAGEQKTIPFSIKIPKNTDPGGYFAAIMIRTTPPTVGGGEVSIGARLGTLVFLRVNGNIKEGVDILEFATKDQKRFFHTLPIEFYYRFQNTGDDRVKPIGDIIVKDTIGLKAKVLFANRTDGSVLPRSIRRFESAWMTSGGGEEDPKVEAVAAPQGKFMDMVKYQMNHFALGMYTANLNIAYGQNNTPANRSFTFFVFPWQLMVLVIGGLIIVLIFLTLFIKSYNKRIISRAQKNK